MSDTTEKSPPEEGVPPWLEPAGDDDDIQEPRIKMRTLFLAGGVLVFIVFAVSVWLLYDQSDAGRVAAPVSVEAPDEPVRERPADQGGMEVEHQDKLVFEAMNGESADGEGELAAAPEEPVGLLNQPPARREATVEPEERAAEATPPPLPSASDMEFTSTTEPAESDAVAEVAPAAAPPVIVPDAFLVQLGSYGSDNAARAAWRTIQDRHVGLVAGLALDIQRADLGQRGIYHRLRAGPLYGRDAADELCASLRAEGQACIVATP